MAWSCPGNRCEVGKFLWSTQVTSDELFSGWECSLIRSPDKVLGMSVVEWMGLLESVVGCVIWMTVVTWAVRCLRPCVVESMSECVYVCGGMSGGWLTVVLTDWWDHCVLTVQWGVWGVSEVVRGWVHEWMCGYVCVGMSGGWLIVVLTDWWDDCVLTVQWVSEGCLRPCVVGSMSECVYVCGGMSGGWLIVVFTDWWDDCVLTVQWVSEGCLRPCVVGSMSECVVMCVLGWVGAGWLWSWLTDGMTVCWLCSEGLRGVWGRVWLGPWVNVWLCVGWDEWELADCGLDWLMGWLCVDCAVRCLRGVWGRVWLGPWVNVWLCVWWDEWELADCGLDWLMGWLCVDCAVRCPRGVWGCAWLGPWVNVWLDVVGWVGAVCLGQWVGVWLSVCIGGGWVRCLAKFLWSIQVTSEANFTNMV